MFGCFFVVCFLFGCLFVRVCVFVCLFCFVDIVGVGFFVLFCLIFCGRVTVKKI